MLRSGKSTYNSSDVTNSELWLLHLALLEWPLSWPLPRLTGLELDPSLVHIPFMEFMRAMPKKHTFDSCWDKKKYSHIQANTEMTLSWDRTETNAVGLSCTYFKTEPNVCLFIWPMLMYKSSDHRGRAKKSPPLIKNQGMILRLDRDDSMTKVSWL